MSRLAETHVISDFCREGLRVQMLDDLCWLAVLEAHKDSGFGCLGNSLVLLFSSKLYLPDLVLPSFNHFFKGEVFPFPFWLGIGESWILYHFHDPISKELFLLINIMIKPIKLFVKYLRFCQVEWDCSAHLSDGKWFEHLSPSIFDIVIKYKTIEVSIDFFS